jgi:hypothetical protein
MGWPLRVKKDAANLAPAKSPKQTIVYGYIGSRLLGPESNGTRPFVRAVRIVSASAHATAIERGQLQESILRAQKVLVRRPENPEQAAFYRNLEALWAEVLPSEKNRATHFIECGILRRVGNDRQPYIDTDRTASVFFQGAFTIPDRVGWVRDRNCVLICDHLLSQIEDEWDGYTSAALVPTYVWILMSLMACWKKIRPGAS